MPETDKDKSKRQKVVGVNFLEVHYNMGQQLGIDSEHVIVDREDNKNQYKLFNQTNIE